MVLRRSIGMLLAILALVAAVGCGDDASDSNSNGDSNSSSATAGADATSGDSDEGSESSDSSDSDSSESTGAPLSQEEFVAQANAICLKGKEEVLGEAQALLQQEGSGAKSQFEIAQTTLLPNLEDQIAQIRALNPPSAVAAKAEAFLKALEQSIDLIEEKELSDNAAYLKAFKPAGDLARAAGLTRCDYGY